MALLQPVAPSQAPAGYQVAGTLGPSPTQDLLAQLAQQHTAALAAAKSGPVAPVMPTAAELQAQLQARTGISGPQYGGAGLGSAAPTGFAARGPVSFQQSISGMDKNPMEAALARASNQAGQVQTLPANPVTLAPADLYAELMKQHQDALKAASGNGILGSSLGAAPTGPVQPPGYMSPGEISRQQTLANQNEILRQHEEQLGLSQKSTQEAARRQQISNDPAIVAQMDKIQSMPENTQKYVYLNNYKNQLAKQYPGVFLPTGQTQADVVAARAANSAGVRAAQAADARRVAEAKYYQDRSNAMAAHQNQGFNLGNMLSAMNPLNTFNRVGSGQGGVGDYMKLAKYGLMFL